MTSSTTTTIYGIKNCSTMKKAFDCLSHQGIDYVFFDYKKHAISTEKLQQWLQQIPADTLLNKKGTTWKKLSPEQQSYALANQTQLIEMLQQYPSMIKRPVLEFQQQIIVGFDQQQYQQLQH